MAKHSITKLKTESLLNKIYNTQLRVDEELSNQQTMLVAINEQLKRINRAHPGTTHNKNASTIASGHNEGRRGRGLSTPSASSATPYANTTEEKNNYGNSIIPYPAESYHDQRGYYISKPSVMNTIKQHLLPHVALEFFDGFDDDNQSYSSSSSDQLQRRTVQVFIHIAKVVADAYRLEAPQRGMISMNKQSSNPIFIRTLNRLETTMENDTVRIDWAEHHWLAKYFISRYLRISGLGSTRDNQ